MNVERNWIHSHLSRPISLPRLHFFAVRCCLCWCTKKKSNKVFFVNLPFFFFAAANYRDNFRASDFLSLRLTLERNSAAFDQLPKPRNIFLSALVSNCSSARISTFLFFLPISPRHSNQFHGNSSWTEHLSNPALRRRLFNLQNTPISVAFCCD